MRSLILFGVLALCFIVALGDIEQETEAVADVLVREAREAGKRNPKKKSIKKKGRKSGKRTGRRTGKNNGNRRTRKRNQKKKKNAKKGRRMSFRLQRQGSVECNMTKVRQEFNLYTKSVALGRQAKQALKIIKQITNKKDKCATAFVKPAKVLGEATTNGTTCAGAVASSAIQNDYITLNNCSVSSCELCDMSGLGVDKARLEKCETDLKNVSDTAAACLRSGSCTCLDNPPTIPGDCDPYVTTVLDALKGVKKKCTGADVLGSFTNCSALAKEVPKIVQECGKVEPNGPPNAQVATARARDLRGMFNKMML